MASRTTDSTVEIASRKQASDGRIVLLEEEKRLGKASALNKIFDFFDAKHYDYLVVTNGVTLLHADAVDMLVEHAESSDAMLMCGSPRPILDRSPNSVGSLCGFIWDIHNAFLSLDLALKRPHCTDELMRFSSWVDWRIPPETVDDGAYFSVLLSKFGQKREYCPQAIVGVSIPLSIQGFLKQRSRMILGRILLKKEMGYTSDTFESVALSKPGVAFDILGKNVLKWGVIPFIRTAALGQIALLFAITHSLIDRQAWIWERVEYADVHRKSLSDRILFFVQVAQENHAAIALDDLVSLLPAGWVGDSGELERFIRTFFGRPTASSEWLRGGEGEGVSYLGFSRS